MANGVIPNHDYEIAVSVDAGAVNVLPYNSSTNTFTVPRDGYIAIQTWGSGSSVALWFGVSAFKMSNSPFITFVKKGMQVWVEGSGSNRSAYYYPLI